MYNNTSRLGRYSARAAAIASIAIIFGSAACGTETASDSGEPAAPAAPAPQVKVVPHTPMSADAAERQGAAAAERWGASEAARQLQEQYLRHLDRVAKQHDQQQLRRQFMQAPNGREIPIT
jgi:hypothetical protein